MEERGYQQLAALTKFFFTVQLAGRMGSIAGEMGKSAYNIHERTLLEGLLA